MRAAIYFTPPAGDPLTRAAAEWLGRDAFLGAATRAPDESLDPLVAEPARYGFHATIRAPFSLLEGLSLDALDERLALFAADRPRVILPALTLAQLGPFFAIVPAEPNDDLAALEAAVVRGFESFRRPLGPDEIARRKPDRLSERQRANLLAWGYPHVFEDFRFHMTLTGPVAAERTSDVRAQLDERFGRFEGESLMIDALALFVEPAPGEPFKVHSLHPLGA